MPIAENDVTVGSRWLYPAPPTPEHPASRINVPFTITDRTHLRAYYRYDNGQEGNFSLAKLVAHAVPCCAADCAPVRPCMGKACPGNKEGEIATSPWYWEQTGWAEGSWRENPPPDYVDSNCQCELCHRLRRSPAPELRCDRDLVCGLYRTT